MNKKKDKELKKIREYVKDNKDEINRLMALAEYNAYKQSKIDKLRENRLNDCED